MASKKTHQKEKPIKSYLVSKRNEMQQVDERTYSVINVEINVGCKNVDQFFYSVGLN